MLTRKQIDYFREQNTVTNDVGGLVAVIDAMRAKLQEIADDYPGEEKPKLSLYLRSDDWQSDFARWLTSKDVRAFLARLDAGMPEETSAPDDNIGDIPF